MARILIVDDDHIVQQVMSYRLQARNFDVIVAQNGVEGVDLARSSSPDIILMDMRMPTMDGWEATRQLKASPVTRAIPIIAVTTQTLASDHRKCFEAGCDEFIPKPVRFQVLMDRIESILKNC